MSAAAKGDKSVTMGYTLYDVTTGKPDTNPRVTRAYEVKLDKGQVICTLVDSGANDQGSSKYRNKGLVKFVVPAYKPPAGGH